MFLIYIKFPSQTNEYVYGNAFAVVDCTSHFRERIHPGSTLFYRGDKHAHFLNALVVCGLNGHIYYVSIGFGRNSDLLLFQRTGLTKFLSKNKLKMLGDRGFKNENILYPIDPEETKDEATFNSVLQSYRSVVENVNTRVGSCQFTFQARFVIATVEFDCSLPN